ncbi:hypothetical protein; putative exported protein [Marinobacter nauticus ATCC 49840]|uniref:hypothetical protein n=1 Tax=Marinobacter nauticus TaxID=2743 RepID=UPI000256E87B|nr:hypothetical protein [Marinobacter nauticus]CCG95364.1 hypothetical protein; putative exported protein [Marinobacter nauticus ATCC 49840]
MEISAHFKIVFWVVVGLTVLSFLGQATLAFAGSVANEPGQVPVNQANFQAICDFGWKAGIGGILGLLGGKAA